MGGDLRGGEHTAVQIEVPTWGSIAPVQYSPTITGLDGQVVWPPFWCHSP